MYHFRKTRRTYATHNKKDREVKDSCPFPLCNGNRENQAISFVGDTMYVMPNRVSYDVFESRRVLEHLMVMPKRHVESIGEFTDAEKLEMMNIIGDYEKRGFNVYARAVGSKTRSVSHQHTHLIKTDTNSAKVMFFMQKPYFLIKL